MEKTKVTIGPYKGFTANITVPLTRLELYGKVNDAGSDLILLHGGHILEIIQDFESAIDDYINTKEELGDVKVRRL